MKTILMRHTVCERKGENNSRILSEQGKDDAVHVANFLKYLKLDLNLIISSPVERAVQTAQVLLDNFNQAKHVESTIILPGSGTSDLLTTCDHNQADKNLWTLVIMHEPDMSYILEKLLYGKRNGNLNIYPGDTFVLDINVKNNEASAELISVFSPLALRKYQV